MSGVIDSNGVQWEHCNGCTGEGTEDYSERGRWVRIDDLYYEPPSQEFKYGRDLCSDCASPTDQVNVGVTISIDPGYVGQCHLCTSDARKENQIWIEFNEPIPAMGTLPEIKGCFAYACDKHK